MVGHDAVVTGAGGGVRTGRPVVLGLGVAAILAIATAVLVALLGSGTATAQTDPGPQPYGGALEQVDPADAVTSEQVLEVSMLALGTLNGVAFAIAMVASRLRGPTTAQTRRALINRTGAGVVSESRRDRRERMRSRTAAPAPSSVVPSSPVPTALVPAGPPAPDREGVAEPVGGPSSLAPRTPPPGAVPSQAGPAPREGLVPAGRAPQAPRGPQSPPHGRPGLVPMSPPTGVPSPVRPASRR